MIDLQRIMRAGSKQKKRSLSFGVLFWIIFIFIMCFLFFLNRHSIVKTILKIKNESVVSKPEVKRDNVKVTIESGNDKNSESKKNDNTEYKEKNRPLIREYDKIEVETESSEMVIEAVSIENKGEQDYDDSVNTRDVDVYFVFVSDSGSVTRERCVRTIEKSDSPMKDSINLLLKGTTKEESKRGLRSFIPADTKLLSVSIKEGTALINLSDDFQFNRYGVEGYNIQLQQMVFTACSFKNVRDVQFLIDGQKRDYIGAEGVWIGSPLDVNSF